MAELQKRLKAAYPATELMALETGDNPRLLPDSAFRVRFHSVGGYGTIASGKLLTDILAGVLDMHSKSAPKYGSEKSGAPTNFYITLSPEPIKITNAELEDVEVVISPDHRAFSHTNPLRGLAEGGTFILQSNATPEEVWAELPPRRARRSARRRSTSSSSTPSPSPSATRRSAELATRMMGIAFIGAVAGHVQQVSAGASADAILEKIGKQIAKKFGAKGAAVVEGNMAVIREGIAVDDPRRLQRRRVQEDRRASRRRLPAQRLAVGGDVPAGRFVGCGGMFDREYFDDMIAKPFREGTIGEAPVLPGTGLFMPAGTAGSKDKGLFRRAVPIFNPDCVPAAWSARWSARMRRSRTRCTTSTNCCSPPSTRSTSPKRSAKRCAARSSA
jgi:pyruvate-ferredoxin/flavodoxin oxidoreductase